MSHKPTSRRMALLSLALALPMLAACTFTPVYGPEQVSTNLAFNYSAPTNRFEQIVYQELGTTLGRNAPTTAPLVSISVSTSSRRVGRTSANAVANRYEMIATGSTKVVDQSAEPATLANFTRTASATYELSGQILSDNAAQDDARERAAKALAQTIRLTLLAQFANGR